MRTLFKLCLLSLLVGLLTSISFAQLSTCLNSMPQIRNIATVPLNTTATSLVSRSETRSPYQPGIGLSQYLIDGQAHMAPSMGLQYIPRNNSAGKWIYSGGFVWSRGGNTGLALNSRTGNFMRTPVYDQSGLSDSYTPSLALAYAGIQYRYYFLQGDIQPYVGAGAQTLGWRIDSRWGAALSPNAVAGVTAKISTIFSGYAEVQHTLGMGNIYSSSSSFGGITMLAFGFSFAPNLSRW